MRNSVLKKIQWAGGLLLFLFAFGVIQYYIWSDLYTAELDTDNAETLMWAQASIDSGRPLSEDFFYYGVMIPLGGHLLFTPFVKAFGVGMQAMRCGFCLLSCLFAGLLLLLFHNFDFSWGSALAASGILLLFTVAPERLRDIFWAHVVYYGMSALFCLILFNALAVYWRKPSPGSALFLSFAVFLGSCNGNVILLYTALPFFCGVILETLTETNPFSRKNLMLAGCTVAALIAGIAANHFLTVTQPMDYVDNYTAITASEAWVPNALRFPEKWISLFTDLPTENVPAFSPVGIKLILRIGCALSFLLFSLVSRFAFGKIESRTARVFLIFQGVGAAAIAFFFIFGNISKVSRRLMPVFFNTLIVDMILVREWLRRTDFRWTNLSKMIAGGLCVLWGCCALMNGVSVLRQPADLSHWYGQGTILKTLYEHDLTHGYTTYYWATNSITVLTNGEVTPRAIKIKDHGFYVHHEVNDPSWYAYNPDSGRTFLVCLEREFYQNPWLEENAIEVYRATQDMPYYDDINGYFILVYDRDVIAEYLQTDPDGLE